MIPLFEIQGLIYAPLKQIRSQSHYFLVYPMTNVLNSIKAVLNFVYNIQYTKCQHKKIIRRVAREYDCYLEERTAPILRRV